MRQIRSRLDIAHLGLLILLVVAPPSAAQTGSGRLPARLEEYLKSVVRPTPAEYSSLKEGKPLAKLLKGDPNLEVSVFGGIWINAPMTRYIDAVNDIENFERGGGVRVTRRISSPPRLEDFALLKLPEEDIADLRTCEVADCEIKLGQESLQRFRTEIDWNAPDRTSSVNFLMRKLATNT